MLSEPFLPWDQFFAQEEATLLFVIESGRVLLIRKLRGLGAGKITAPGGRIDPGETPERAAVRELEEEVGVGATNPIKVGELCFQFRDGYRLRVHVFRSGDFTGRPHDTAEAIPFWSPIEEIPYEEMWADDSTWIPHLLAWRSFEGRFRFDGDRMLDQELDLGALIQPRDRLSSAKT